jgi:hypothetical protein
MPSVSLVQWRTDRMPRLAEVDARCAASLVLVPPQPNLVDENLRAYALLLSAHFQGFCRDLYTECALAVIAKVRRTLRTLIEHQFTAGRKLDHGNPNVKNLRDDFERFEFTLDLYRADPANPPRLAHLDELNRWRNVAATTGRFRRASLP